MKDAYSFDLDWDQAGVSYEAMYNAYTRIFKRCGLATKVVEADTGVMGGKKSQEFMVPADSGEDGIVECESCNYAANVEMAERAFGGRSCGEPIPGGRSCAEPRHAKTMGTTGSPQVRPPSRNNSVAAKGRLICF